MSQSSVNSDDPSLEHNFRGHKNIVTGLAFSVDNKQLASSSNDRSIVIWNLHSNASRCYNFTGHTDIVTSVEFSPNGQLLASASQDRTVRLWVPTIRGKCTEFRAHTASVRTVSFHPDGTKLITGSNDKTLKLWEVHRHRFLTSFSNHRNWIRCARFSPTNDTVIASCSDDRTLRLWDTRTGQSIHSFPHVKGLIIYETNKIVNVTCTISKTLKNCIFNGLGTGQYLAYHPTGTAIAIAMSDGGVRVYDLTANKLRQNYMLHENTSGVAWHPNGNFLLSCGTDSSIRVVDVLEGHPLYTLKSHATAVNAVAFSKDGSFFASGGVDKHVMVWKTNFVEKCSPT